jgi:hypothetical protein
MEFDGPTVDQVNYSAYCWIFILIARWS